MTQNAPKLDLTEVRTSELEYLPTNDSANPHFDEVVQAAVARRGFLKSGAGAAALAFLGGGALLRGEDAQAATAVAGNGPTLGFTSVSAFGNDTVVVPAGYTAQVFYAWGDPIGRAGQPAGSPVWKGDATETAAEQELQAGMHHDGMHFFPFPARGAGTTAGLSNTRGLLVMNHEYVDQGLLFADGMTTWNLAKVRKSQAAHGVSVIEARRTLTGQWEVVRPSAYARRITANTPVRLSGPATARLGTQAFGTLNNCANGYTPWGTYLTCEENWNGYFGAKKLDASGNPVNDTAFVPDENEKRYGVTAASPYQWHHFDERFDLNTAEGRKAQYTFGWVVEIDPFSPNAAPIKRTALGRIKHESAEYTLAADGRVVIYTGDDQAGEYIYKFVSKNKFDPNNRTANLNLLDEGTLYVARFSNGAASGDNMGTGEWLPLTLDNPAIAARFATLADMLLATRIAADLAGATKMDRPEWIAANPKKAGEIYCTLTNNSSRTAATADDANPRANNVYGQIIRWREAGGDPAATSFEWDLFVLAGDPALAANAGTPRTGNINGDTFACPDGLWFDSEGRLWIQTDISSGSLGSGAYANLPNNMMLAANPVTGETRRFLTGPKGCEVTGIAMTPDRRTMFVNIQHPGEGAGDASNPQDAAYPIKVSSWPSSQGYGYQGGTAPQAKLRPRSATVVITRNDGGEIGA
ncbi:MAG: PhoX family phosphatase [Burkholderiales bacterium]|nr:PhoX family phosphatase [Burkholderiales bacterium]